MNEQDCPDISCCKRGRIRRARFNARAEPSRLGLLEAGEFVAKFEVLELELEDDVFLLLKLFAKCQLVALTFSVNLDVVNSVAEPAVIIVSSPAIGGALDTFVPEGVDIESRVLEYLSRAFSQAIFLNELLLKL